MAITNTERVGRGLEQLKLGLGPFVERELKATYKDKWRTQPCRVFLTGRAAPMS